MKKFGTAPVFFTAISTILGAILFLRFGWAVGTLGFWGVVLIILLGHLVTIPTALAISELATNRRVLGGGEYFIISRSFGLNIGATIGFALFLSQSISVAFYVIAFTEAFSFLFDFFLAHFNFELPRQVISVPVMAGLGYMIYKQGANMGVKVLYLIVGILFVSLLLFFIGNSTPGAREGFDMSNTTFRNGHQFFFVFAIIFPAFTGMTAGVGLSGDLKNPSKSIPLGTLLGTISGMIIYFFVVYKLASSASIDELVTDQLIMSKIALGGFAIIPLGLAASTFSSALGSILVAPRTLQALANDGSFPIKKLNKWLSANINGEPKNASMITIIIAMVFVALGDVNAVASVISMFFMVTYGSICLISFLHHFGSSPSYRPTFRSKWVFSLIGFLTAGWVMFKIDTFYAFMSLTLMTLLYLYISHYNKERGGLQSIFANAIFQVNRNIQVYLQRTRSIHHEEEWRPSAICISSDSLKRDQIFKLLNWLSYKYGFSTYLHLIPGYYSKATYRKSKEELAELISRSTETEGQIYLDTLISPSYTSAIAQAIQLPGIAGMENNMVVFEYEKETESNLLNIIDNFALVKAGEFDVCIMASSQRNINFHNGIHIWIKSSDYDNANLMIMLSFIIVGHPDWRKSSIKIFEIAPKEDIEETRQSLEKLVKTGRLPITTHNIEIIPQQDDVPVKSVINHHSSNAALTIMGFRSEMIKHEKETVFQGYDTLGTILFVNSHKQIEIA